MKNIIFIAPPAAGKGTQSAILKKKYNLPKTVTFHSLRHSFATYFLLNGGNLITLQSLLGHSNLNTTRRYTHFSQDYNHLDGIRYVD